jgi:hypothetical protein
LTRAFFDVFGIAITCSWRSTQASATVAGDTLRLSAISLTVLFSRMSPAASGE